MRTFLKKSKTDKIIKDLKKSSPILVEEKAENFTPKIFGNILLLGFLGLVILLLINSFSAYSKGKALEKEISEKAFEGISMLLEGGKKTSQIELKKAKEAFLQAQESFASAKSKAWFIKSDKSSYAKRSDVNIALNGLLDGGVSFANAGSYFLEAMDSFNLIPVYFVSKNKSPEKDFPSLTDTLKKGLEKTDLAIAEINAASEKIANVNVEILPEDLQIKVNYAKEKIAEISEILNNIKTYYPEILKLLGDEKPHKYLVLFQNNQEMRPTGGFIGSYALIDINKGYLEKMETHDVYDLRGLGDTQIDPPEDFRLFTSNWRFRDSNYSPDFSLSAQKALWFLEAESGISVDTVIAINQGLLRDMLAITGPIQVGDFGKLDSYNYDTVLSYVIESKMWGAEDPKHILKVFVPAFAKEIMNEKYLSRVSGKIFRALEQKHIMFYSKDENLEALFDKFGVSGKQYQLQENEDYIQVINISSGGTKSDKLIEEKISHDTRISENGEVIDTVSIKRTHLFNDQILKKWKEILQVYGISKPESYVLDILGRGRNRTTIRIYVPKGSILVSSTDPEMKTNYDAELNKTYFTATIEIFAGQSKDLKLSYKLPFRLDFSNENLSVYKLIAEKMPGHPGQLFTKTIEKTESITPVIYYPESFKKDNFDNLIYAKDLVYDRYFSALLKKEIK
ncbi:MAG: DUF4012 domain-containing protein [Candidatus Gracilibacteria bacterium]|jgi:hypothetical protein|nr:DUF4012 domain-containing protein [Candidatus Gracilibacteria bacterium]